MVQFYFAWIDEDEVFDAGVHGREDEKIVSFTVEQLETEFASLSINIRNPRVGFLCVTRKRWAFLSWFDGASTTCLFKGRVVAVPSGINREIVQVQLIARPDDYAMQKEILAETLRVLPYYDPVFISEEKVDDPDVVLEGRTEVWHIDRVTHTVTVSDLIEGDETLEFGEGEVPYDSVEISIDQPPIKRVKVTADVSWGQAVAGSGLQLLKNWKIQTLAGSGVVKSWPKADAKLSGGYLVSDSRAASLYDTVTDDDFANWMIDYNNQLAVMPPPFAVKLVSAFSATGTIRGETLTQTTSTTVFSILDDRVLLDLSLGYAGTRKRNDIVEFTLVADTQPVLTEPGDDEVLDLKVSGNDVGLPIAVEYDAIPIGDVQRRSYFTQDRGQNSLQYLLQLARANIIVRSRAVKITFKCSFARAIELSLRKTALIEDRRIPGGSAVGKIVGYAFRSDQGEISGTCTIACAIGYGGVWEEVAGDPTYVEEGVLELGVQVYENSLIILGADDVAFEPLVEEANDDGLIFPLNELPIVVAPHNTTVETKELTAVPPTITTQMSPDDCGSIINSSITSNLDTGPYTDWLSGIKTTVDFSLKPITGGPFITNYVLSCTTLKLPMQIDLGACYE